jgi:DNA-binding transcriptional LysR family regulator
VPIAGDITLNPAGSLREAALVGLGYALLSDWLVDQDIVRGDLIEVFPHLRITATSFGTGAWLVDPSRAYLPSKARAMADFLRAWIGSWAAPAA